MTKLILLAGNNKKANETWISQVEAKLSEFFDKTHIQYYNHWQENKSNLDLEYESKIFSKNIDGQSDYVIFAKSAGAVLAIKNIYENGLKPKACIFVGAPMGMIFHNEFPYEKRFKNIDCPILFIQKTSDPTCSYLELVKLLSGFSDQFKFQEIIGNTHDYEDVDLLKNLIGEFIKEIYSV